MPDTLPIQIGQPNHPNTYSPSAMTRNFEIGSSHAAIVGACCRCLCVNPPTPAEPITLWPVYQPEGVIAQIVRPAGDTQRGGVMPNKLEFAPDHWRHRAAESITRGLAELMEDNVTR